MNKKICALVLALGLSQFAGAAVAEPKQNIWTPLDKMCFLHNGTIYPSVAGPGEYKTVYGPYTGKCATSYHKFQVRNALGLMAPVVVERLEGGTWTQFRRNVSDPSEQFGAGTFRIMLDNRGKQTPVHYKGTFSVPL